MATLAINEFLALLNSNNPALVPPISEQNCNISDCAPNLDNSYPRNSTVLLEGKGWPYKSATVVYYNRFDYTSLGLVDFPYEDTMTKAQFLKKLETFSGMNFKEEYLEDFTLPAMDADFNITITAKGDALKNYFCVGSVTVRALYKPSIEKAFLSLKFNGL